MKSFKLNLLVLAVAISVLSVFLVGWVGHKHGVVEAQPLSCYEAGATLICVDGAVYENMTCSRLDESTILCEGTSGERV